MPSFRTWLQEAWENDRTLTWLSIIMLALMIPTVIASCIDTREVHGVNTWIKPLKFMSSLALFSITTAWFTGLLTPSERMHSSIRFMRIILVVTGIFEIAYITFQAALGQPSHYNIGDPWHRNLYHLMGLAALLLTSTQLILARKIATSQSTQYAPQWRKAVVSALVLTFILGASTGMVMGGVQAPAGAGVPVLGWHMGGGDLRPAHFMGIHAQQIIPLAGLVLGVQRASSSGKPKVIPILCGVYVLVWGLAMVRGLIA